MSFSNKTLHDSGPSSSSLHFSPTILTLLALLIPSYLLLVRKLRYSRMNKMRKTFGYTTKESLSKMTATDAQKITMYVGESEFPSLFETSMQFALFKTYGIPTIAKTLVDTKQFSSNATAEKRLADTAILITEFNTFEPNHPRALAALARMNYLHSSYIKAGKITNDDLLYTLSVFITEPVSWIGKYEWRPLNDMEICALAVLYQYVGNAMSISYAPLAHQTWKSGLEFYADIKAWAESYEQKFMVPSAYAKQTADELVPLLIFPVPKFAKPFAAEVVACLMPEILRNAMSFPTPSPLAKRVTASIFGTRAFVIRHLSLPRPQWAKYTSISQEKNKYGKYEYFNYIRQPYYNVPNFWNQYGPKSWISRSMGALVPDMKKEEFAPKGYDIEDVGPKRWVGKGLEEMGRDEERIKREVPAGCPYAFGR